MAFVRHGTLKRAQRADAKRTQDVRQRRVLGAMGTSHLLIRDSESCGGTRTVPNVGGGTLGPNAQALVATPGGGRAAAVISRPPSGAGGALPPLETSRDLAVTQSLAEGEYLAFYRDDATHLTVERLDADGSVTETVHNNLVVPSGTISTSVPGIALIAGDGNVPDESFTIYLTTKFYVVNGSTGTFTELFDDGLSEGIMPRGVYYDAVNQKVMMATWFSAGLFGAEVRIRSVDTDGTNLSAVLNSDNQGPAGIYQNGACLWTPDRLIAFFTDGGPFGPQTTWDGCVELPFDGSAVVDRTGDLPLNTAFAAKIYGADDSRYFAQLDATGTYFEGATMPLTSGNASSLSWSVSTLFAGNGDDSFASLAGDNLCLWPVLKAGGGTEFHVLRIDKDTAPSHSNLVEVDPASAGSPLVVLAVS